MYHCFIPKCLRQFLARYMRAYEIESLSDPKVNLDKHYSEIILYGEVLLARIALKSVSIVSGWKIAMNAIKSGSPEMVNAVITHPTTPFQAFHEAIARTGYLYLLSSKLILASNQGIINGLAYYRESYINITHYNRVIEVFLRSKHIEQWTKGLLISKLSTLKIFRKYLGTFKAGHINCVLNIWTGEEDETIRYIYLDENGLRADKEHYHIQHLIGDMRLSCTTVEELIKGTTIARTSIIPYCETTDDQIQHRKQLFAKYGIMF